MKGKTRGPRQMAVWVRPMGPKERGRVMKHEAKDKDEVPQHKRSPQSGGGTMGMSKHRQVPRGAQRSK
jgi:hypothetical protein